VRAPFTAITNSMGERLGGRPAIAFELIVR
jgi:hypothetical protein